MPTVVNVSPDPRSLTVRTVPRGLRPLLRRVPLACTLGTVTLALLYASVPTLTRAEQPARVVVAEYDGIIHPIAAEFFDEVMTRADTSGAAAVVFVLRTPGGLLESTRTIVSRMIAAPTPVIVYIGPPGSRAASAGF